MRRIILTASLFIIVFTAFSQEEKNGTIYIKHPYIQVVDKANKAYLDNDMAAAKQIYSDTARFWASGMPKPVPIADALKMWSGDFTYYDSIRIKPFGYPDYLNYIDGDQKVVQSWGVWFGKSKKTGNTLRIDFVQFDDFNKDGKITFETLYGDFSQMGKN
jgi:hypothetical protein